MDTTRLGFFLAAVTVLLLTPGPAVFYIVTRSFHQGRRAGVLSAAGITVGTLVHVAAASLGVSALLAASAAAFATLKYLGAAYLIYLGVRRLRESDPGVAGREAPRDTPARIFAQGILVNILNPKTALFVLAFLPQFVDPRRPVAPQILTLGLLLAGIGLVSDSAWAVAAGSAARWLRAGPGAERARRYVSGGAYIGLGLAAALVGMKPSAS
ncbi:MAG TPA: LysE family translocator [Thermoanaerobaculia bacterium]|jgi:threonine/homoserine/homoserine lactone efflux protein